MSGKKELLMATQNHRLADEVAAGLEECYTGAEFEVERLPNGAVKIYLSAGHRVTPKMVIDISGYARGYAAAVRKLWVTAGAQS